MGATVRTALASVFFVRELAAEAAVLGAVGVAVIFVVFPCAIARTCLRFAIP